MHNKFMNLDEEKRNNIINAGMKEFADKGYDSAKTDNIVEEAGISKGLLFHYFGTKKDFFLFLVKYAFDLCYQNYVNQINMDKDIFVRLRKNTLLKERIQQQNPDLFNFLMSVAVKGLDSIEDEVSTGIIEKLEAFRKETYTKLFNDLDLSKFRDDVDINKAIEVIIWTIEGYQKKNMSRFKNTKVDEIDYKEIANEIEEYFSLLRLAFYKDEYNSK